MDLHIQQSITTKLKILKRLDAHAKELTYALNPVLSEGDVESFEDYFSIRLPHTYRWFLTTVGNGGAGPGLRLHSLQDIQQELELRGGGGRYSTVSYLSRPFVAPSNIEESVQRPIHCMPGMLPISHIGCGLDYYLCVSGEESGNVWYWSHGWYPFPPLNNRPDVKPWLDEEDFETSDEYDEYEERISEEEYRVRTEWKTHLLSQQNTYRVDFLEWYLLWLDDIFQWVQSGRTGWTRKFDHCIIN